MPNVVTVRNDPDSPVAKGMAAYDRKYYRKAHEILTQVSTLYPDSLEPAFYAGVSLCADKKAELIRINNAN